MLVEPIYTATIRGERLRFFKTPNTDGRPDLPWHSVEDLAQCIGLNRQRRRFMLRAMREGDFKGAYRDVATAEGILTIAPHYVAQGTIAAMKQRLPDLDDVDGGYTQSAVEAMNKLTGDLDLHNGGFEYLAGPR